MDSRWVKEAPPGSSPHKPGGGLTVGGDGGGVGEYTAPNKFTGKVESATVHQQ